MNRDEYMKKVEDFIEFAGNNDLLLVMLEPGLGKSVTTWSLLTEGMSRRVVMLSPKHENIEKTFLWNKRKRYENFTHMQGRERPGFCFRPDVVKLSYLVSVSSICEKCPHSRKCLYIRTRNHVLKTRTNVMASHSHSGLVNDLSVQTHFDCCIVDENPCSSMVRITNYDKKPKTLMQFLAREGSPLETVIEAIFANPIDYGVLRREFGSIGNGDFRRFERILLERFEQRKPLPPTSHIIKEIEYAYNTAGPLNCRFYRADVYGTGTELVRIKAFDRSVFNVKCPVIVLDASGTDRFYRLMSNRMVYSIFGSGMRENLGVKQISDGRYTITTLINELNRLRRTGIKQVGLIQKIVDYVSGRKRNMVSIIASKRFKNAALPFLSDMNWVHFYSQRGLNAIMNVSDVVIIAMCPNIPQVEKETNAGITPIPVEEWDTILVRQELEQAIGRVRFETDYTERGDKRGNRIVYVLTNEDIGYGRMTRYQMESELDGIRIICPDRVTNECAIKILSVLSSPMTEGMITKNVRKGRAVVRRALRFLAQAGDVKCLNGIYEKG